MDNLFKVIKNLLIPKAEAPTLGYSADTPSSFKWNKALAYNSAVEKSKEQAAHQQNQQHPMVNYVTPTPTPVQQVRGASVQNYIRPGGADFLEKNILPYTNKLGIPNALSASQWATEGGRVQDNPQHNVYGLMRGGHLIQYPSLEANINDYGLTIKNILKAKGYDMAKLKAGDIIKALQAGDRPRYEAHNADPNTYINTVTNTPEWRYYNSR